MALGALSPLVYAQVGTSSLSGTVVDTSDAVIPGAEVNLKDEATSVVRSTVANDIGFFRFGSLLPGSYTVTVSCPGFNTLEQRGIVLHSAESRTLPNLRVKPAGAETVVDVVGTEAAVAPMNTGESRTTLNENMVGNLMIQGRNAAELIKILPGMAIIGGGSMLEQTQYSSLTTQSNSGVVGRYSANGTQPYGGLQLTVDGGVIVDTGNMGTQTANINQDQTAELTVRNSAFDAEYAHGPVTISATSKGGSSDFHGNVYTYARGATFNSQDSYLKNQKVAKPNDHYWYPGFTLGGPLAIPGTSLNKNRDKLFFFTGFEYMVQHPVGNLVNYLVPTEAMRNGDFSNAALAPFKGHGWATDTPPCDAGNSGQWWWGNFCEKSGITNGNVANYIDPNGRAYMKTFPMPNANPAETGGFNYQYLNQAPVNRWELKGRIDYEVTESTRIYGSYNRQHEENLNTIGVWWWPGGSLPYPSNFPATQISNLWSTSVTHVFSPTLTNETTFNFTSFINPLKFADPDAVNPSKVGMNIKLPFDTGVTPMIPNTLSWGCNWAPCMPAYFAPAFSDKWQDGAFGALKRVPSLAENLAWVKNSHTLKFGAYWSRWGNQQTEGTWDANSGFPQGRYEFDNWAWGTTGNPLADMLIGHPVNFAQTSADPVHTLWFTELAFYGQDSWKVNRRLTVNFGVRFTHQGQWFPSGDTPGVPVWDPSNCTGPAKGPGCIGPDLPGFSWHGRDSSIPISGFKSKAFYPDPRVGAAYDLFGNGNTVLRGGFGVYRFQFAYNSIPLDPPLGIQAFQTTCNLLSWNDISKPECQPTTPAGTLPASSAGLAMTALQKGDDRTPYTQNWNFIIDQRAPWNSLFTIGYTGSRSRDMLIGGNGGNNPNRTPLGAYFKPDPVTGETYCLPPYVTTGCTGSGIPSGAAVNFRPYNYGNIQVNTHGSYSNYHGLQLSWQKQTGRASFMLNYTFSKVLGLRDGQTDNGTGANGSLIDPFNLANNYGVLGFDRSHLFNAAYVIQLPDPIKSSSAGAAFGKAIVNGWKVSGIVQRQSGSPIQPSTGGTLNAQWPGGESTTTLLGTDAGSLVPVLTCDPRKGLSGGQYFNPACFAPPTVKGQNGHVIWPYIKGPAYFDADLGLYKSFVIAERKRLEFGVQAFNFLNHPLPDFTLSGSDLQLSFNCGSSSLCKPSSVNPVLSLTNTNSSTNGKPLYTRGRRVMEMSLKFFF